TNFYQIFFYDFKLGSSAVETARNINEVSVESSVGESTVRTWFWNLRSGDFDLEDKEGHGRPNELHDDELKALSPVSP
ncbi:hypothetical protein Angca_003488, partial [Angiostrongylus cantonensis]